MADRRRRFHVSVVGAGTVGTTLALMLSRRGNHIVSVISRDVRDAKRCARIVGADEYSVSVEDLSPRTDLLLITTPEDAIRLVATSVARLKHLSFKDLSVCHISGALSSRELEPLRQKGCLCFSFHPIQTFPRELSSVRQVRSMKHISYGAEGSAAALRVARKLTAELGGRIFVVPKEQKILYHLICVLASNYSTTLIGVVEELAARIGGKSALEHFRRLTQTSVDNAFRVTPGRALTGPLARASAVVVRSHMSWLKRDRNLRALYRQLALQTVKLALRAGRLTEAQARMMRRIVADGE